MHGVRGAGVAAVVVATLTLACLAGSVTKSHAASQSTAVAPVLSGFATGILDAVVGGIRDEAIAAGFDSLLGFIGLDEEPPATAEQVKQLDERVARVEQALAQVTATVTETKRNVDAARLDIASIKDTTLRINYDQAAQEASKIVAQVDTAMRKIDAANAAPPGKSDQRTRDDAESYISQNIDGAAERLQAVVFGDPERNIGATPLIQAAFAVAAGNSFLTHAESVHIRYLTVMYTNYEALAAIVTAEYRRSRPGYRAADIRTYLNNWIATVKAHEDGRRQPVPVGTLVDARTLRMWSQAPGTTRSPASRDKVTGPGSYTDWSIPNIATYRSLIDGYATTPKAFLQNHGFDVTKGNVVMSSDRSNYTACQPGFSTLDLNASPPTPGVGYGVDLGGCNPGTHNGATTYEVCTYKAKAGRGGGFIRRCTTKTDAQQVAYNNRKFGNNNLFYAVRSVPVGSFLPPDYRGPG